MPTRHAHPPVFMFLIIPFRAMGGYVAVALAYLFSKAGVPVGQTAALVAVGVVPHTWKFLWAPLVESLFTRKGWYLAASVLNALGIFATAVMPIQESSIPPRRTLYRATSICAMATGFGQRTRMIRTDFPARLAQ